MFHLFCSFLSADGAGWFRLGLSGLSIRKEDCLQNVAECGPEAKVVLEIGGFSLYIANTFMCACVTCSSYTKCRNADLPILDTVD